MVLNKRQAVDQAHQMLKWREYEQLRIDRVYRYWRGEQPFLWIPEGVPSEVRKMADMSRLNVLKFIVDAAAQAMYVDGFRGRRAGEDEPVWDVWQANRMDSRQIELHRATLAFGSAYMSVFPGQMNGSPIPRMRPASPRKITAVYGEDDDWPIWVLEKRRTAEGEMYRLMDDEAIYWLGRNSTMGKLEFVSVDEHGAGVPPVVRYRDQGEIDGEVLGQVEPHIPLQDQINLTTFALLVAQHYGAHRQRYIIGWLAESEEKALKASAQRLWTFEDDPNDVKVGEFEQTDLKGYIDNREATVRFLATLSQTPVHEMLGQMVNMAADALAAARDSHNRKLEEHRTMAGESHEQTLQLAGQYLGIEPDLGSWVRWRDMETRTLAQTADALGKFAEMLGIPRKALWERAADALGASQQEVAEWERMAEQGDPFEALQRELDRQVADLGA